MAELGFELRSMMRHDGVAVNLEATPMHNATGNLAMVKLLIELGADPNVRDLNYHGTPLGWAAHNDQQDAVEYLMSFATIFDAVQHTIRRSSTPPTTRGERSPATCTTIWIAVMR